MIFIQKRKVISFHLINLEKVESNYILIESRIEQTNALFPWNVSTASAKRTVNLVEIGERLCTQEFHWRIRLIADHGETLTSIDRPRGW